MESVSLLDCAGRRRSPATLSSFHQGRTPRNKGHRYPPDPPTVEEIIAVMRAAGEGPTGMRLRGVIVVLWRAGLRISEAVALAETDLDRERGAILVRAGKGGRRREVGMDRWAWEALDSWLELRSTLPVGALFCVLRGPTRGRPCPPAGIRMQLHDAAQTAGVRRGLAPHQLRHAHAVEMSREGIPLVVIQRQPGHADLGITSAIYAGSTTPRSSIPSTNAQHPWFRSGADPRCAADASPRHSHHCERRHGDRLHGEPSPGADDTDDGTVAEALAGRHASD
jgi:integrase